MNEHSLAGTAPRRVRLIATIALVVAVLVGGYSLVGVLMAGSATQSNPANVASYRTAAWTYLSLTSVCIAVAVVAIAFLVRGRGAPRPRA